MNEMSKKNEVTVIDAENRTALSDLKIHSGVKARLEIDLTAAVENRWGAARLHSEAIGMHFAATGLLLLSIKQELPHGEFLPELERRGFEERTARRAMRYAEYVFSQPEQQQARLIEMPVTKVSVLAQADPEVVELLMEDGETVEKTTVKGLLNELKAVKAQLSDAKTALNDEKQINQGLTKKKLKSDLRADTQLVRDECLHQQALCDYGAQALLKAWNAVVEEPLGAPEHNLRREQIILAARAAAAATAKVLFEILESQGEDAVMYAGSEHMLTAEEASTWATEWETLRSGLVAKDAARFDRAQADLPRDVGRPKGSKTKTAGRGA
jgi:hypothetical protein